MKYTIIDSTGRRVCAIECQSLNENGVNFALVQDMADIPDDLLQLWRQLEEAANDQALTIAFAIGEKIDGYRLKLAEVAVEIEDVQIMDNGKVSFHFRTT